MDNDLKNKKIFERMAMLLPKDILENTNEFYKKKFSELKKKSDALEKLIHYGLDDENIRVFDTLNYAVDTITEDHDLSEVSANERIVEIGKHAISNYHNGSLKQRETSTYFLDRIFDHYVNSIMARELKKYESEIIQHEKKKVIDKLKFELESKQTLIKDQLSSSESIEFRAEKITKLAMEFQEVKAKIEKGDDSKIESIPLVPKLMTKYCLFD